MNVATRRVVAFGLGGLVAIVFAAIAVEALRSSDPARPPAVINGIDENSTPAGSEATPTPAATSTPSPTPTPEGPAVLEHCYEPRTAAQSATGLLPAREKSLFQQCQLVAFYGHPDVPAMGALGQGDVSAMIDRLMGEVAAYEAIGPRAVVPVFHLITAVAHPYPTDDGSYLGRMDYEVVERWIDLAEEHDFLVLLDLQMGHSTVEKEVGHYLEYLKHPRVHLALDPEWAMKLSGLPPGQAVGNMDAAEINRAQEMLQELVDENGMENKVLVIHQFQEQMIRNKEQLQEFPGVDLVIHTDGFGTVGQKVEAYNRYVRDEDVQHAGFKLFYIEDPVLMPPADVQALAPQPDVVTFQ